MLAMGLEHAWDNAAGAKLARKPGTEEAEFPGLVGSARCPWVTFSVKHPRCCRRVTLMMLEGWVFAFSATNVGVRCSQPAARQHWCRTAWVVLVAQLHFQISDSITHQPMPPPEGCFLPDVAQHCPALTLPNIAIAGCRLGCDKQHPRLPAAARLQLQRQQRCKKLL